jgi:hypothetical protein
MNMLARNMAAGAVLLSSYALLGLPMALLAGGQRRTFLLETAVTLAAVGALGGAVFTALGPLRRGTSFGAYVSWILTWYLMLGAIVALGTGVHGDDPALLREPAILALLLGSGALMGVFCARVAARGDSGHWMGTRAARSSQETIKRRRYEVASWCFAGTFVASYVGTRSSTSSSGLLVVVMAVSVVAFIVTTVIAASPVSVLRTILALTALMAGLGFGIWIFVSLRVGGQGRLTGIWFEAPFIVVCGLAAIGCLITAAVLTRE